MVIGIGLPVLAVVSIGLFIGQGNFAENIQNFFKLLAKFYGLSQPTSDKNKYGINMKEMANWAESVRDFSCARWYAYHRRDKLIALTNSEREHRPTWNKPRLVVILTAQTF